jgi:hypothetical protein
LEKDLGKGIVGIHEDQKDLGNGIIIIKDNQSR